MAKEYALDRATGRNRHPLVLLLLVLLQGAQCQRVKVDPEVQAYPGQNVTLRCQFVQDGQAKLTQVSWIWEPPVGSGMEKVNVAVFHPQFKDSYPNSPLKGRISFLAQPASLEAPSIQIQGVQLTDEGKFICEFATYPNGNEQGIANLIMLAKPVNSAKVITVTAGDSPVTVARCESANGKPAAQLSWVTALVGNGTLTSVNNANGTVTVRSEYWLTPSGKDDGMDLSCVVSHPTLDLPQSFPLKLAVEYPPQVEIIGYDENWYMGRTNAILHCKATGNPPPTNITWKTLSGEKLPETVKVNGNQLTVQKVDETVNTTFVCEVSNRMGPSKSHLTVAVRDTRLPMKGAATGSIIGGIIGVLLLGAIIGTVIMVIRRHRQDGPPKYKPPPPKKTGGSTEMINRVAAPDTERLPLDEIYYETNNEPVTDLDRLGEEGEGPDSRSSGPPGYHYGGPSNWDDLPQPPYRDYENEPPPDHTPPTPSRNDSFISSAMFV
ncbi:nectin-2 isoform X2 [Amia ocellicauda]|uniref:nectin-2 isoform X2 n=1 Tax=Amia ocellicauda TaxID=2972642 RepID=UPI003464B370